MTHIIEAGKATRFKAGNPGRQKGSANKVTNAQRQWFQDFLDRNAPSLQHYLNRVAYGVRAKTTVRAPDGTETTTESYIVEPNPARAFELVLSMAEFCVPKMQRVDRDGKAPPPPATSIVLLGADAALAIAKSLAAEV